MVSDLLMATAPKPPGSRQLISPPAAVFEIAPANVLHGAVRLHGLTSSPTPETQVRVAWACAGAAATTRDSAAKNSVHSGNAANFNSFMGIPPGRRCLALAALNRLAAPRASR